jgi:hypothetical protein
LLFYGLKDPARLKRQMKEIQPHQHLNRAPRAAVRLWPRPESVDAADAGLYKTANGGGRNPAADVL